MEGDARTVLWELNRGRREASWKRQLPRRKPVAVPPYDAVLKSASTLEVLRAGDEVVPGVWEGENSGVNGGPLRTLRTNDDEQRAGGHATHVFPPVEQTSATSRRWMWTSRANTRENEMSLRTLTTRDSG